MRPLPRSFYERPADEVAYDLIGKRIIHRLGRQMIEAKIVETEAYVGIDDLACHASKGRTKRTEVMFGPGGYAYVYLIYGMHEMFNIVTSEEGNPHAVLIRAAESDSLNLSGPGRFTRGMKINRHHNGLDLCRNQLFLVEGTKPSLIKRSARIGVDYAGKWKDAPLRFYDASSPFVSRT